MAQSTSSAPSWFGGSGHTGAFGGTGMVSWYRQTSEYR